MGPGRILLVCLMACSGLSLPRFEVYWDSKESYLHNEDELNNPWYIDLGAINVGGPGYIGGPNIVTVHAADYCYSAGVNWDSCLDNNSPPGVYQPYVYPPQGVPARPGSVEDWSKKFNITGHMMREGIERIHQAGGKVNLAYGGELGIATQIQKGENNYYEDIRNSRQVAKQIADTVDEWNLDGVDFFFSGEQSGFFWSRSDYTKPLPGSSATFHLSVIKALHEKLKHGTKTISYTTTHDVDFTYMDYDTCHSRHTSTDPELLVKSTCGPASVMETVIMASHPYLDHFAFKASTALNDTNLNTMAALGVPLAKLSAVFAIEGAYEVVETATDAMEAAVRKVKERGLGGISLFSINEENRRFRGSFARMLAEFLYL